MRLDRTVALFGITTFVVAASPFNRQRDDIYRASTDLVVETVWTITTVSVTPTDISAQSAVAAFFEWYDQPSWGFALASPIWSSSVNPWLESATTPAATAVASSSGGQVIYNGDITYYDASVGLGSCGWQGSNDQDIVALPADVMQNGDNPNDNPNCGKTIYISYQGNIHGAIVYDTCPTCLGGSIDSTKQLFLKVAPDGDGRVSGVSWWFAN